MMDQDSVSYKYEQWDGTWGSDELTSAAQETFEDGTDRYFISWASGTIEAGFGGMGGSVAYHMASFDYAYNAIGAMEWLFHQTK